MKIFKRQLLANNGSMFRVSGISQLQNTKLVSLVLVVVDSPFLYPSINTCLHTH